MLAPLLTPKGTLQYHSLSYSTSDESSRYDLQQTWTILHIHVTGRLQNDLPEIKPEVRTGCQQTVQSSTFIKPL